MIVFKNKVHSVYNNILKSADYWQEQSDNMWIEQSIKLYKPFFKFFNNKIQHELKNLRERNIIKIKYDELENIYYELECEADVPDYFEVLRILINILDKFGYSLSYGGCDFYVLSFKNNDK